jgi:methylated-DNA-[protein]-cysteine S-methyltransferase
MYYSFLDSPVGGLLLLGESAQLRGLYLENHRRGPRVNPAWRRDDARLGGVRAQLSEYFAGERRVFDIALSLDGTVFQRRVWNALREIPFGETRSYGELAEQLGAPRSARAVGAANARNPISIIVPCHRVVGATGDAVGYAGGVARKTRLLALEGQLARA